ncbi:MAG TPA: TrpB-like pyridoxal phosphate-dependent enzyme [Candidatus Hydrogenedentes bacterium]|mgnify:CR=1 FL=1|jgi:tryptophan synthase beta chain|nr:MAG: Tryptophan synthase beta chain [Candidatus Hydrogenedentes bacterium ADurb.Bin170]HNZ47212.1 TrpB-like pyridoxal phosphate-dependent enzyme [Candidatus Hydrogenedentota bacterium]HOH41545.1 TrpB-like pyridoxal phosphate-dependent enzyme [Candidatus Hydrogenedentota bacterium]HPX85800.1 TrpB-like pyridoxal phosphate-dependent enzyme [Candidatus Hydrogenedentota bacterium]HQB01682.1 TrpB-like pyridoxal phosphate-dependent enzyme [Candidatus Hydrogenedentota bacterium]
MRRYVYNLDPQKMPDAWYNILPDLPTPHAPVLHPATHKPVVPEDLAPIFPMNLIEQEMSSEPAISIPGEVMDRYLMFRPTPLRRAYRLEEALQTPAKIYYKNESVTPSGSHKINTSIPQAYYNKVEGVQSLSTETGAGQWGTALSIACAMFNMQCKVYMVRVSFDQKPYRKGFMETFGATVIASPSDTTEVGRKIRAANPGTSGSLGMAISEAVEVAVTSGGTVKYSLGSVLNHVCMHQTIIGEEALLQMEMAGDYPDVVIGCCGGGSNFAGIAFPFVREKFNKKLDTRFIAAEPTACPTLTKGPFAYDFGDTGQLTPLIKQYTLGHNFVPPGIHAGGLRYHGVAATVAHLKKDEVIEAVALHQNPCFQASLMFAKAEGIIPAPESGHAVRSAIDEAIKCRESGEAKTILFNLSGHGHFDITAYEAYLRGNLQDLELDEETLAKGIASIPEIQE